MDKGDDTKANYTYGEFGVNQAISILLSGNPSGEAPPGTNGVSLGSSTITYSTNTQYWVNVSIPHLYLNGDLGNPKFIPAGNMQVQNINSLANQASASDIPVSTYFPGEDMELCVWGASSPAVPLDSPGNGTTAHGPWGSNYNNFDNPGGVTFVEWYVDVPGSMTAGIYSATITYSIETQG